MYILYISPRNETAKAIYTVAADAYNARAYTDRDAGFDLFCDAQSLTAGDKATLISQQTSGAFYDTDAGIFRAFWLLPRSSISKTPMQLANSVGLIDAGYRGDLMAAVRLVGVAAYEVVAGRYFQVASPDLLPWDEVRVVDTIPGGDTLRGAGGFGSTGVSSATASTATSGGGGLSYFA